MEDIYSLLWLITAAIAVIPVYVFWTGYRKIKSKDLLITSIAFTLFFVKALIMAMELFVGEDGGVWYLEDELWFAIAAILDMIIIVLIVVSFTRKLENGTGQKDPKTEDTAGEE